MLHCLTSHSCIQSAVYGVTEAPNTGEKIKAYNWLILDTEKGAPFSMHVPVTEDLNLPLLCDSSIVYPYSRWTRGRKSNPNFDDTGSGFEGHLCAFQPDVIQDILLGFENQAYRIMKQDVGAQKLSRFIEDPSSPVGIRLLNSGRDAFEILLAQARALRSSIDKGGYFYVGNSMKKVDEERRVRSRNYESYIQVAPPAVEYQLVPMETGTLAMEQIIRSIDRPPVGVESLGADIKNDRRYRLISELGRMGHPVVPHIRNSLRLTSLW